MVTKWMMSADGFCLGVSMSSGDCQFPLPSIAHQDPTYKDQSYWRGRTWGPFNCLVYWGLAHPLYAKVPAHLAPPVTYI